jgi:hypothetical protein
MTNVGIEVDEDTLPHILTFTLCDFKEACKRDGDIPPAEKLIGKLAGRGRARLGRGA